MIIMCCEWNRLILVTIRNLFVSNQMIEGMPFKYDGILKVEYLRCMKWLDSFKTYHFNTRICHRIKGQIHGVWMVCVYCTRHDRCLTENSKKNTKFTIYNGFATQFNPKISTFQSIKHGNAMECVDSKTNGKTKLPETEKQNTIESNLIRISGAHVFPMILLLCTRPL